MPSSTCSGSSSPPSSSLLNGFFVAAEFALVKISTTLANTQKAPREDPRIERARTVVSRLDRYLSVTQFGITLASLGLGWIGEPAVETQVDRVARFVTGHEPGKILHYVVDRRRRSRS